MVTTVPPSQPRCSELSSILVMRFLSPSFLSQKSGAVKTNISSLICSWLKGIYWQSWCRGRKSSLSIRIQRMKSRFMMIKWLYSWQHKILKGIWTTIGEFSAGHSLQIRLFFSKSPFSVIAASCLTDLNNFQKLMFNNIFFFKCWANKKTT